MVPSPLSIWPIAARMVQDSPGQYLAAESRNSCRYVLGSWPGVAFVTGSCCWRRLTILADRPSTFLTWAVSRRRLVPGALISAATRCTRPSWREVWVFTSRSTAPIPSDAAVPNVTACRVAPVSW